MRRNVDKMLEEYQRLEDQGKAKIYYGDLEEIRKRSCNTFDMVMLAMEFGVVMGYRVGKRESRGRR